MSITFIGGGNMATAIAGGLVARGRAASGIAIVDPVDAQRAKLEAALPGVRTYASATAAAIAGSSIVVLAVKPQQMREACAALAPHVAAVPVVLSIAAGSRSADISRWLGGYARIVRAMPDTPSLVGAGIAGLWSSPSVDASGRASATAILEACGEVVPVGREEALDAVTGVSASGPAYVFYLIESLEAAARSGFRRGVGTQALCHVRGLGEARHGQRRGLRDAAGARSRRRAGRPSAASRRSRPRTSARRSPAVDAATKARPRWATCSVATADGSRHGAAGDLPSCSRCSSGCSSTGSCCVS
jgi:pyrroline-5-carboxylate reductase